LNGVDLQSNCAGVATQTVTILGSPIVDFEVSDTAGCLIMDVTFTDLVNAPNTSLLWDFGDGETSNQPGAIDHQYDEEGCYDITLTISNTAGCSVSVTQSEMVCAYDYPNALFYIDNDTVLTTDTEVNFINQSTNAYSYLWEFGDGTTSLATNPVHVFPETPLDYIVTLYAYNEAGCYDTMMLAVTVYEELLFYVPNSFTPNNDGSNDIFLPIMTSGFDRKSYELIIFNRWGEEVFRSNDPDEGWDGSKFNSGSSSVEDMSQDGVYTWKVRFTGLQNELASEYVGHVVLLK
jgi:gliding motility-associated-like protein